MKADPYQILLEIGILHSLERNHNKLHETILCGAMDITGADAGTLYLLHDDKLHFEIMITKSMGIYKGGDGEPITLPPVPLSKSNVCTTSALSREIINIPDVYNSTLYDFTGTRNYDKITGYKTTSAMVVPMVNDVQEVIGVIQLINAQDDNGNVIPFAEADEKVVLAIASQAAISLTNVDYTRRISELLEGFIRVISTAIDARTPYNANHTKNMVRYAEKFFVYEDSINGKYVLKNAQRKEFLMSVWLHDIGKLVTPLEIMDKATRLGDRLERVKDRFSRYGLLLKLALATGKITQKDYEQKDEERKNILAFVLSIDAVGFLNDENFAKVQQLASLTYTEEDGTETPLFTEQELEYLSVRKGTLTVSERSVMEDHVVMTDKMLSGLRFPKIYANTPLWAAEHHEYINGTGYPHHLQGEQIPWQVRLLTILDIFEALTACDRPYKPPMPPQKALAILRSMMNEGKLDGDLLEEFSASNAWE